MTVSNTNARNRQPTDTQGGNICVIRACTLACVHVCASVCVRALLCACERGPNLLEMILQYLLGEKHGRSAVAGVRPSVVLQRTTEPGCMTKQKTI